MKLIQHLRTQDVVAIYEDDADPPDNYTAGSWAHDGDWLFTPKASYIFVNHEWRQVGNKKDK